MPDVVKRCEMLLCVSLFTIGGTASASAQVTYTVFPAVASQTPASASQPVDHGGEVSVTLVVRDSTIAYVMRALTEKAHLHLSYNNIDNPLLAKRVSVNIVNMRLMDALAVALQGTGLVAKVTTNGESVVIREQTPLSHIRLAGGSIVGRVTDSASGQGLSGASVKVEGTKLSSVTSDSGHFTLRDVPVGDQVLSVKLFGYRPAERVVTVVDSERTSVRFVLVPVPTVLSGVVTTAVGVQQRYQVGNDITVLNADSIQQIAPVSTVTQMLETRVPGLIVEHTTGIPGSPSRLRLRGVSSINQSNDPILVVNGVRIYTNQSGNSAPNVNQSQSFTVGVNSGGGSGVGGATVGGSNGGNSMTFAGPSALDQIDPNSIETIEILKGPSATAIYGSDAAAGVIVITTKRGHTGSTHWNLNVNQGRTTLPGNWPVNYYRFGHSLTGFSNSSVCSVINATSCELDSVVAFQALNDPRYSPLIGQSGQNRDGSLTVSGGSGTVTYSLTGTASTQSGYLHLPSIELERFQEFHGSPAPNWMRTPDQYTTYGENSQLTVQLGKHGGTLTLSDALFRSAQQQSSLQNDLATLQFMYVDTTQLAAQPLFPDYYTRAQLNTTNFTNTLNLNNYTPWSWLPLNATVGLNVQDQNNNSLLPRDYITCVGNTYDRSCGTDSLGAYTISQGTNTSATLTVGTTLRQRMVNTAVGINVYTLAQNNFGATTQGLPIGVTIPNSFNYGEGGGPSYSTVNTATYGWYVQPTFNLSSRFFVSPGFRLDGGSNSGTNGRTGGGALSLFPKLDVSWIAVSRSPSNPMFGALTLLRPRIAFGIAGVQPGPAEQLRLLEPNEGAPLTLTGGPVDELLISDLGNTQLHPERDQELEGGFDAGFWNQRLSLTITSYNKMAYDAILAIPVAPSVDGGQVQARNIGTIQNTGVEATIAARILDSRAVAWSVNANVTQEHNKVISLVAGQSPIVYATGSGYQTRLIPGYPLFGVWAQPIISYADINGDGAITCIQSYINCEIRIADSAVYLGTPQPNYEMTVSTTLAFFNNRLSLNTSVDYQSGLTQINGGANTNAATLLEYNNPQTTSAQEAAIAALNGLGNKNLTAFGVIQTVNILRWNTLSINYLVPPNMAHIFRVPTLSLALQGSNLALRTNYRGKDPGVNAFSSGNLTADTGQLPQPRVWSLRVSIGN